MNRPIDRKPLRALTEPALRDGDRMNQPEFHRRYVRYPGDVKFELVGGIVYMASPTSVEHSDPEIELGSVLDLYRQETPGVQFLRGVTMVLGAESEPQPDLILRIRPEYGGRSTNRREPGSDKTYIGGAPELIAEVAFSSRAIDLHAKRDDYQRTGVQEYVVFSVGEVQLYWFDFASGGEITPNRQGVCRSRVFPGLWIDRPALLALDGQRLRATLRRGLASREHAAFVRRLQAACQPPTE